MNIFNFYSSLAGHLPCLLPGMFLGILLFTTAAQADEWTVYNSENSNFPGSLAREVAIDEDGAVWIATDAGLARLKSGEWRIWNEANSSLPGDDVRDVDVAGDIVWVATNRGLFALDRSNDDERVWTTANSDLPANFIRSLAAANDLAVWLATPNGLAFFATSGFIIYNTANSEIPSNNIQTVELNGSDGAWCGTEGGGVARITGSGWTVFNESNSALPSNIVFAIRPVGPNEVYFGAWGEGLAHFKSGEWNVFNSQNSGLAHNWINSIALNKCGGLVMGTRAAGVSMLSGSEWETISPTADGLPNGQVFCATIDPERNIWLGFNGGLALLELEERAIVGRPARLEYCAGSSFALPLGTRGAFDEQNSFFVQLSDPNGDFSSAITLSEFGGSCARDVTLNLREGLPTSSAYRLRVVSSLPPSITEMEENLTIYIEPQFDINGPNFLCVGETATLSVEAGFNSYLWNTGENTRSIEITAPGTYSVDVVDGINCTATKRITVGLYGIPVIFMPEDTMVCSDQELDLTIDNSPGQIRWSPAELVDDPTAKSIRVNISESTTLQVELTSPDGCITTDSIRVEYVEAPAKPSIEVSGETLIAQLGDDVEFAIWLRNGELIADAEEDPEFTPTQPGLYVLSVVNARGCGAQSEPQIWPPIANSVQLDELHSHLELGPHPFDDVLLLRRGVDASAPALGLNLEVRLYDIMGAELRRQTWGAGLEVLRFRAEGLAPGVYLLVFDDGSGQFLKRVVVKR